MSVPGRLQWRSTNWGGEVGNLCRCPLCYGVGAAGARALEVSPQGLPPSSRGVPLGVCVLSSSHKDAWWRPPPRCGSISIFPPSIARDAISKSGQILRSRRAMNLVRISTPRTITCFSFLVGGFSDTQGVPLGTRWSGVWAAGGLLDLEPLEPQIPASSLGPSETTGRRDHQGEALRGAELPAGARGSQVLAALGSRMTTSCLLSGSLFSVGSSSRKGCLHTCSWSELRAGACCPPRCPKAPARHLPHSW